MSDPFRHHPNLRDKITPADTSFWRSFTHEKLEAILSEKGLATGWWYDDATREALRMSAMEGRWNEDLWVFAYGSLIWDPALKFSEVRRAHAPKHCRRFILLDDLGGRGTKEQPGLMAALDECPPDRNGCAGLAFRVPAAAVADETEILFRREMLAPGYNARFIPVDLDCGRIEALTFVADHDTDLIAQDISREDQLKCITTGVGFLGSSFDYLKGVVDHLHEFKIPDPELDALLMDAKAVLKDFNSP